jgi:hypothetical protein
MLVVPDTPSGMPAVITAAAISDATVTTAHDLNAAAKKAAADRKAEVEGRLSTR